MADDLADMITALLGPTSNQRVEAGHAAFDPFTAAAYRQRQAVSPVLGREEGVASHFLDRVAPVLAQSVLKPPVNALSMINALARHTTGDLLFPLERTTNQKLARQQQLERQQAGANE